jgi:hypothetical protein
MKIIRLLLNLAVAVILGWQTAPSVFAAGTTLVPAGAVWRYLDTGIDPGPTWRAVLFDDSAWSVGRAQLGYGDGDEVTIVSSGPIPGVRNITTYFRHTFAVTNAAAYSNLTVRLVRDDGAVVYLNGLEVLRVSIPAGPVTHTTPATDAMAEEQVFVSRLAVLPGGLLVNGPNVLAVEIHQVSQVSSDISFDLELADEPLALTSILDMAPNTAFASPASFDLTAKAAGEGGVTSMKLLLNGVEQANKDMRNRLYASFPCSFAGPTNCSLAVAAYGNAGFARTSAVQVVVEPAPEPGQTISLVNAGAQWKYLDDGSDQGSGWPASNYDDQTWSAGPAILGYGRTGIATPVSSTGTNGARVVTTYLRHAWDVADPSRFSHVFLRVLRDDGVKVFLNGAEVYRNNVPSDPVAASTPALEVTDPTNFLVSAYLDSSLLVTGRNILATEIHQAAAMPADMGFDLELIGLTVSLPKLAIQTTSTNTVLISWPYPSSGFRLMETPSLSETNWTEVTTPATQVGADNQVPAANPQGARFYRLRKP